LRKKSSTRRLTAVQAVALLSRQDFRAAVEALPVPFGEGNTPETAGQAVTLAAERIRNEFKNAWGVTPPHSLMLNATAPRAEAEAILTGRWGLIRVFPWISEADVVRDFKRIRSAIGKAERRGEPARRVALAAWLMDNGYTAPEIAGALFNRTTGLKRVSRRKAARSGKANAILQKLMEDGLEYKRAEARAISMVQGNEAPAAPSVRMKVHRYRQSLAEYATARLRPLEADPMSACVMRLLRARYAEFLAVPEIKVVAADLDPIIDELRRLLLTPPSA
jgi:hypothetical protein